MYKLTPPPSFGQAVIDGIVYEKQADGFVHVQSEAHRDRFLKKHKGWTLNKKANAPVIAEAKAAAAADAVKKNDLFDGMTKDELKGYLDERAIEYSAKPRRDELLELAKAAKE